MKQKNTKLYLILLLAFLLRFPGVWWGELYNPVHNYFEPDEHQHLSLAIETMQIFDATLFEDFKPNRLNTQGFSTQLGFIGAIVLPFFDSDYRILLILGRLLSLTYGVLLVWLTYKIGILLFKKEHVALLAALFLSIFDLHITYSHYGVPEIFHVFWAYCAVYLMVIFWKGSKPFLFEEGKEMSKFDIKKYFNLILFSFAFCLAAKFDFIPILIFGLMSIWALRDRLFALIKLGLATLFLTTLYFELAICFQNETLINSFKWLLEENRNLIGNDNHLVINPFLYLIGGICGTSLIVFGSMVFGLFQKMKRIYLKMLSKPFSFSPALVFTVFVLFEFLVLWNLDAPFVRRINIFLPYIALFASFGIYNAFANKTKRKWAIGITILYTFSLTIVSQFNFIQDTRYQARDYVQNHVNQAAKIYYCPYSKMKGMPKGVSEIENADLLVIHESNYRRYWKSFTTPFVVPECCEGVYHCKSEAECLKYQKVLSGKSEFELVKKIEPVEYFPERIIYKRYFGTYETFLGDVLIYQQRPQ